MESACVDAHGVCAAKVKVKRGLDDDARWIVRINGDEPGVSDIDRERIFCALTGKTIGDGVVGECDEFASHTCRVEGGTGDQDNVAVDVKSRDTARHHGGVADGQTRGDGDNAGVCYVASGIVEVHTQFDVARSGHVCLQEWNMESLTICRDGDWGVGRVVRVFEYSRHRVAVAIGGDLHQLNHIACFERRLASNGL